MPKLTFKTVKGKHIITYNGISREFKTLKEAWRVIFAFKQYLKQTNI